MGRVLWVEDDAMIRKLVTAAFRSTAHELRFAENGRQALDLVGAFTPDIVFTDVAMPEMNGLELADALRGRPGLGTVPIVFVTASLQREQIERYFAHGAAAYIAKPFSVADLRAQLARMLPS